MKEYSELKKYAEIALATHESSSLAKSLRVTSFYGRATPTAVLELISEVESLKKDASRYRTIKKDSISDGSLIERLDCNVRPSEWDSYIDSVSVK